MREWNTSENSTLSKSTQNCLKFQRLDSVHQLWLYLISLVWNISWLGAIETVQTVSSRLLLFGSIMILLLVINLRLKGLKPSSRVGPGKFVWNLNTTLLQVLHQCLITLWIINAEINKGIHHWIRGCDLFQPRKLRCSNSSNSNSSNRNSNSSSFN